MVGNSLGIEESWVAGKRQVVGHGRFKMLANWEYFLSGSDDLRLIIEFIAKINEAKSNF
jgi:hypothetical protein